MKRILAVSGGIDSVVMLDFFAKNFPHNELVVATFDHGTRESSALDVDFVAELCSALKIPFYRGEAKLGAGTSEEKAREERYKFLRKIAFEKKGEIYTAHHLDDLVETIAINFLRGTGWRGLACFSSFGVRRPFLDGSIKENGVSKIFDKKDILKYAAENNLIFREDPTNSSADYLRNRLRPSVRTLSREEKNLVYNLWKRQREISREIDQICEDILPEDRVYERAWFKSSTNHPLDEKAIQELLRFILLRADISATRPQILDFSNAIKAYLPGKKFNLPNDRLVKLNKNNFTL